MEAIIESAKGSLESLLRLPILLLIPLAMIVLGIVLKRSAAFPNRFIPLVVVPLSAVLTCFVLPYRPGDMDPGVASPGIAHCIRCSSIGLVLGFVAWGTHRPFTKLMERYVPGFDTRDTEMINKP